LIWLCKRGGSPGLRLLERTETKTEVLRILLVEGEQSGIAEYSLDAFIEEIDSETGE